MDNENYMAPQTNKQYKVINLNELSKGPQATAVEIKYH